MSAVIFALLYFLGASLTFYKINMEACKDTNYVGKIGWYVLALVIWPFMAIVLAGHYSVLFVVAVVGWVRKIRNRRK